jgi:hypothetical protein
MAANSGPNLGTRRAQRFHLVDAENLSSTSGSLISKADIKSRRLLIARAG